MAISAIVTTAIICLTLMFSGCDMKLPDGGGDSGPNHEEGTTSQSNPASSKLETAKSHIKTCLDSWSFGDDQDKFDSEHPNINFVPLDDILRQTILTKYELRAHREYEGEVEGNNTVGFEFNASLYFATNGGGEVMKPYTIKVYPVPNQDDYWTVFAQEK